MLLLSPPANEEFSHLLTLGGGIFKNRIIHVSLALAAELIIETEEQGPDLSIRVPSSYGRMLTDAVKEARWQLAQRQLGGETNVRLHVKLGIVLSQAEGSESGADGSLQQQMAQSERVSLLMSYSNIQACAGSAGVWVYGEEKILDPQELEHQDFSYDFDFNDILQTKDFVMDDSMLLA